MFLTEGPDGALYYADLTAAARSGGSPTARRREHRGLAGRRREPPLTVAFDGRGSSDPEGGALTYAWDLDGDGAYDDSTPPRRRATYHERGSSPCACASPTRPG